MALFYAFLVSGCASTCIEIYETWLWPREVNHLGQQLHKCALLAGMTFFSSVKDSRVKESSSSPEMFVLSCFAYVCDSWSEHILQIDRKQSMLVFNFNQQLQTDRANAISWCRKCVAVID